jgi:hypothetical protein
VLRIRLILNRGPDQRATILDTPMRNWPAVLSRRLRQLFPGDVVGRAAISIECGAWSKKIAAERGEFSGEEAASEGKRPKSN